MSQEDNNVEVAGGDDDIVDPWNVQSKSETGIDYDKLISKFLFCLIFPSIPVNFYNTFLYYLQTSLDVNEFPTSL